MCLYSREIEHRFLLSIIISIHSSLLSMVELEVSTEISLAVPYFTQLASVAATVFVFAFIFLMRAFVSIHVIFTEVWALTAEVFVIFVMSLDMISKVFSGFKPVGTN